MPALWAGGDVLIKILKAILLFLMLAFVWFVCWMFWLMLTLVSRGYLFSTVFVILAFLFGIFMTVESDYMPELGQRAKASVFIIAWLLGFGVHAVGSMVFLGYGGIVW